MSVVETKWRVCRVEADGRAAQTIEIGEDEARALYASWAGAMKRFNDREVSLVKVVRTETVDVRAVNMGFEAQV